MEKIYIQERDDLPIDNFVKKFFTANCEVVNEARLADKIIVIGGDGTFLHAVRELYQLNIPFIGFHQGNKYSKGFLLNPPIQQFMDQVINDEVYFSAVPMLKVEIFDKADRPLDVLHVFGDCYFSRISGGIIHTRIAVDGKTWFDPIDGDGVLVCTPAGSTAYNASAFGSVLPLDSRDIVLTAICPLPQFGWHSTVLSRNEEVILEVVNFERRSAVFWADGRIINGAVKAKIKQSKRQVKLGFAESYNFRRKVLEELQFRRKPI